MASATTSATCGIASRALLDGKAASRLPAPHAVSLPALASSSHLGGRKIWRSVSCGRKVTSDDVVVVTEDVTTADVSTEASTEVPEVLKTVQAAWEKVDDKYAVVTLGFAGLIALWTTTGVISALDRLPFVPGILELVGIGYTGWFIYRNLVFQPDREALIDKIKSTYSDVTGSSS